MPVEGVRDVQCSVSTRLPNKSFNRTPFLPTVIRVFCIRTNITYQLHEATVKLDYIYIYIERERE